MIAARVGVLAVALTLVGCASSSGPYAVSAQQRLSSDLRQVDRAVVAHDDAMAKTALQQLSRDAVVAYQHGQITSSRETAILRAADRLAADQLGLPVSGTVAPSTPATSPSVATTPPAQPGHGPHKGKGEKKKGDNGDGGDAGN